MTHVLLSTGNPNLKQTYSHSFNIRYNKSNPVIANSFFIFGMSGLSNNYIGTMTRFAQRDTVVQGNIPLLSGSQRTQPVNLAGT